MKRLRDYTNARVTLGRVGHSLPTKAVLAFNLDHARARDAVWRELGPFSVEPYAMNVASAAADRAEFLRRPDLGRRLDPKYLARFPKKADYDAVIVIADGLSPLAVERHATPTRDAILDQFRDDGWRFAPTVIARNARVALGDEIGQRMGAKLVLMLIGERPGLSSPDSLGAYLTFDPRVGRTDAERNCVSNIRAEGLPPRAAAVTIAYLMREALRRKLTGVGLKESAPALPGCS